MIQYSENEKQRLLSFPLDGVLAAFGKRTDHKGYMYYSPFRDLIEAVQPSAYHRKAPAEGYKARDGQGKVTSRRQKREEINDSPDASDSPYYPPGRDFPFPSPDDMTHSEKGENP